eukprot:CAMPEP_0170536864 /NCGR_PEP_ID=MMETSP0209-20121228/102384_1 /TAXON_ID=665100 ORGANISM="Litonotus pictus, Strain P1" /NCGR_SAMPLE_ID=MMETSP0209 /ASSEMBLY_ACC=CAM_ASM_000301 /LENGTH=885 /DNA_ID=CAMNT_0010838279 /DNA_START=112 /DNA_END=2769 /DNA_ORIENTATION=+
MWSDAKNGKKKNKRKGDQHIQEQEVYPELNKPGNLDNVLATDYQEALNERKPLNKHLNEYDSLTANQDNYLCSKESSAMNIETKETFFENNGDQQAIEMVSSQTDYDLDNKSPIKFTNENLDNLGCDHYFSQMQNMLTEENSEINQFLTIKTEDHKASNDLSCYHSSTYDITMDFDTEMKSYRHSVNPIRDHSLLLFNEGSTTDINSERKSFCGKKPLFRIEKKGTINSIQEEPQSEKEFYPNRSAQTSVNVKDSTYKSNKSNKGEKELKIKLSHRKRFYKDMQKLKTSNLEKIVNHYNFNYEEVSRMFPDSTAEDIERLYNEKVRNSSEMEIMKGLIKVYGTNFKLIAKIMRCKDIRNLKKMYITSLINEPPQISNNGNTYDNSNIMNTHKNSANKDSFSFNLTKKPAFIDKEACSVYNNFPTAESFHPDMESKGLLLQGNAKACSVYNNFPTAERFHPDMESKGLILQGNANYTENTEKLAYLNTPNQFLCDKTYSSITGQSTACYTKNSLKNETSMLSLNINQQEKEDIVSENFDFTKSFHQFDLFRNEGGDNNIFDLNDGKNNPEQNVGLTATSLNNTPTLTCINNNQLEPLPTIETNKVTMSSNEAVNSKNKYDFGRFFSEKKTDNVFDVDDQLAMMKINSSAVSMTPQNKLNQISHEKQDPDSLSCDLLKENDLANKFSSINFSKIGVIEMAKITRLNCFLNISYQKINNILDAYDSKYQIILPKLGKFPEIYQKTSSIQENIGSMIEKHKIKFNKYDHIIYVSTSLLMKELKLDSGNLVNDSLTFIFSDNTKETKFSTSLNQQTQEICLDSLPSFTCEQESTLNRIKTASVNTSTLDKSSYSQKTSISLSKKIDVLSQLIHLLKLNIAWFQKVEDLVL